MFVDPFSPSDESSRLCCMMHSVERGTHQAGGMNCVEDSGLAVIRRWPINFRLTALTSKRDQLVWLKQVSLFEGNESSYFLLQRSLFHLRFKLKHFWDFRSGILLLLKLMQFDQRRLTALSRVPLIILIANKLTFWAGETLYVTNV